MKIKNLGFNHPMVKVKGELYFICRKGKGFNHPMVKVKAIERISDNTYHAVSTTLW